MNPIAFYLKLVKEKGRPLSESYYYPESPVVVLTVDDALYALKLFNDTKVVALGGDIVSETDEGHLIYAYVLWGNGYFTLDWSCDREENESLEDYSIRSRAMVMYKINEAAKVAKQLGQKCYIDMTIKWYQ